MSDIQTMELQVKDAMIAFLTENDDPGYAKALGEEDVRDWILNYYNDLLENNNGHLEAPTAGFIRDCVKDLAIEVDPTMLGTLTDGEIDRDRQNLLEARAEIQWTHGLTPDWLHYSEEQVIMLQRAFELLHMCGLDDTPVGRAAGMIRDLYGDWYANEDEDE